MEAFHSSNIFLTTYKTIYIMNKKTNSSALFNFFPYEDFS